MVITSLLYTGITVGFSQPTYTAVEGAGTINVCASRLAGSLTRPLSLTFTLLTMDMSAGNATCMSACVHNSHNIMMSTANLVHLLQKFCELKGGNIGIVEKAQETRFGMSPKYSRYIGIAS